MPGSGNHKITGLVRGGLEKSRWRHSILRPANLVVHAAHTITESTLCHHCNPSQPSSGWMTTQPFMAAGKLGMRILPSLDPSTPPANSCSSVVCVLSHTQTQTTFPTPGKSYSHEAAVSVMAGGRCCLNRRPLAVV